MLSGVMGEFRAGGLKPIPLTVFGARETADAFQTMARAKHIGKIVISLAGAGSGPEKSAAPVVRPDGTYLITGGLGALGLEVTRWLCDRGARHIVLVGRRRPTEAAEGILENMRKQGARVSVMSADLAQRPQLDQVLGEIRREMPPLCGVVHAAGVIDDGLLQNQEWERFEKVMAPKIDGAWNLHLATKELLSTSLSCFLQRLPSSAGRDKAPTRPGTLSLMHWLTIGADTAWRRSASTGVHRRIPAWRRASNPSKRDGWKPKGCGRSDRRTRSWLSKVCLRRRFRK